MIRAALTRMGRTDLIGNGKEHLIPEFTPRLEKGARPKKQGNDYHHRIKTKLKGLQKYNQKTKKYSKKKTHKKHKSAKK